MPLDRWAKTLLALCFAEATRRAAKAAGIDADRLQARTRELLERYLAADLAVPEASRPSGGSPTSRAIPSGRLSCTGAAVWSRI